MNGNTHGDLHFPWKSQPPQITLCRWMEGCQPITAADLGRPGCVRSPGSAVGTFQSSLHAAASSLLALPGILCLTRAAGAASAAPPRASPCSPPRRPQHLREALAPCPAAESLAAARSFPAAPPDLPQHRAASSAQTSSFSSSSSFPAGSPRKHITPQPWRSRCAPLFPCRRRGRKGCYTASPTTRCLSGTAPQVAEGRAGSA